MTTGHDVIVIGLGAMGSAACYQLSKRGLRVLGLDRFEPPHSLGSSHGRTRIIREAYFEHPLYVPLVQRAYELWSELEKESGEPLFRQTGGLMIGPPGGLVFQGAKRSAEEHRLPHEILDDREVRRRFPALSPRPGMMAVWEPRAGILFPENCVAAFLNAARRHGADLRFNEEVLACQSAPAGCRVETKQGRYEAGQLLFTAGAWLPRLWPALSLPLQVERQVLYWFKIRDGAERKFAADQCPIHLWEYEPGRYFYGFPDLGDGVKVARHHEGASADPNKVEREVSRAEIDQMRLILERHLPLVSGTLNEATVCLYTNTPDGHFLIDRHPEYPNILLASPCSGHGFKFSSAIGEILADWLMGSGGRFDLSLFRWGRFEATR